MPSSPVRLGRGDVQYSVINIAACNNKDAATASTFIAVTCKDQPIPVLAGGHHRNVKRGPGIADNVWLVQIYKLCLQRALVQNETAKVAMQKGDT